MLLLLLIWMHCFLWYVLLTFYWQHYAMVVLIRIIHC
uniref:Uncharacterized protein n=1 Tax=Arundo donax TaxID=35708 RepID=A0A0A9SQ24_ARUDO